MKPISLQTSKLHREIEDMPKVQSFLSSMRRNSVRTAIGYKTSLAYFQEFLSNQYNHHTLESILDVFSEEEEEEKRSSIINIYTILEKFITFMQEEKKVSAASINQYLNGIRSFLAYYDVYVIPAKL